MKRIYYLANVVNDYILFGKLCLTTKTVLLQVTACLVRGKNNNAASIGEQPRPVGSSVEIQVN